MNQHGNHTCGMYSNNGVKNKSAQPIMIPITSPDNPVFAPLSWLTADLEKDPTWHVQKRELSLTSCPVNMKGLKMHNHKKIKYIIFVLISEFYYEPFSKKKRTLTCRGVRRKEWTKDIGHTKTKQLHKKDRKKCQD